MTSTPEIERERQHQQARIDGLNTSRERNVSGQFATAFPLALEIAALVRSLRADSAEPIRFLEPALGTGVFYSALRQAFAGEGISGAVGIELDPRFADAASALWRNTGLDVLGADFTRLDPPAESGQFNLILTNPPYVRHHHIESGQKLWLKRAVLDRTGIEISGLAGLYGHFLLLAHEWLAKGGIAAWLIPSEFMEVNYGVALQHYLTHQVRLLRIHRFSPADAQFGDAMVTSAVVVFEKAEACAGHQVKFSAGGSILAPIMTELIPIHRLRSMRKWIATDDGSISHIGELTPAVTLGDLFTIKRGIATGSNSYFIMERSQAAERGIPEKFLRPILPGSRQLREEIILSRPDGYPQLVRPLALLDCRLSEAEIEPRYPALWAYLRTGHQLGIPDGYLTSRRSPWYSQESRDPAPFLCTYMGRKGARGHPFRFFWNHSRAIAPNVYLMLYPRGELREELERHPEWYTLVLNFLARIKPDDLVKEGRVYGGGLYKLEPSELRRLPVSKFWATIRS